MLSDDFEADQSDIDALESEDSNTGAVEIQGYIPDALQSMNEFILPVVSVMETAMLLRVVGEPQRIQTRIKRCTHHHQVSQYYMHALFLV